MVKCARVIMAAVSAVLVLGISACTGENSASALSLSVPYDTVSAPAASDMASLPGELRKLESIRANQERIPVYSIDSRNMATIPNSSVVDSSDGIDEMDVLNACAQNFIDQDATAEFNSAVRDGDSLTVDISAEDMKEPFGKGTGKFEQLFLDCLSKSIFENFPELKSVYFTVNGEAYHSAKLKLSTDKPYMTNE